MSATQDFIEGCAGLIAAAAGAVYRPSGPAYTLAETGIALVVMPDDPATPDKMFVLNVNQPGGDNTYLPIGTLALQVDSRGDTDPRTVMGMGDAVYAKLHGLKHASMGSIHIIQMRAVANVPMGRDGNDRHRLTQRFYADVDQPATANRNLSY